MRKVIKAFHVKRVFEKQLQNKLKSNHLFDLNRTNKKKDIKAHVKSF